MVITSNGSFVTPSSWYRMSVDPSPLIKPDSFIPRPLYDFSMTFTYFRFTWGKRGRSLNLFHTPQSLHVPGKFLTVKVGTRRGSEGALCFICLYVHEP